MLCGAENLFHLTRESGFYNGRLKVNPRTGDVMEALAVSKAIFNPEGLDAGGQKKAKKGPLPGKEIWETEEASAAMGDRWEAEEKAARLRAARRAKRRVYDLAACNSFDVFFTLTLNKEEIDRYDYKAAVRKLTYWLDNRVRRRGLRYLMVPELHKDGAVHFHGLANSEALKLVDSGHKDKKNGKIIYHVADWKLGFTTAEKLTGEYSAVCHYIAKYVTKQALEEGTIGGRYFFHGGALREPVYRYFHVSFEAFEGRGKEISPEGSGLIFRYVSADAFTECLQEKESEKFGDQDAFRGGGRSRHFPRPKAKLPASGPCWQRTALPGG